MSGTGLEISRDFYSRFGAELLDRLFPDAVSSFAVGLCGSGSECFGFDDGFSRDHDFDPGFQIFLPGEDIVDEKLAFRVERAYDSLPKEFEGLSRGTSGSCRGRRGVIRLHDFLVSRLGTDDVPGPAHWLRIPENYLAEVTNGVLFRDDSGFFTEIRESLMSPPRDVVLKKLAGCLFMMSQSGVYNLERCTARGDSDAARLCCFEFFKNAANAFFWLNGAYMPYYKWSFRAMKSLPGGSDYAAGLSSLLSGESPSDSVRSVSDAVMSLLEIRGYTDGRKRSLVDTAYYLNEKTADPYIRNLHVLYGVQ